MPATVTLASTTLSAPVGASETLLKLASTSGVVPGMFLWLDGELMKVMGLDVDPWVLVKRGVDGSPAMSHGALVTVYIGRGDQFYGTNPVGRPPAAIPVSPYINVQNGSVWFAQGDASTTNAANRWWQQSTSTFGTGSLGVRNVSADPTEST